MRLRTILLTTVAVLWLPLSTHAGIGLTDITAAAQRGDVEAQLELGILYEFGYGMANNQIAALAWYTLAAQQGNPKAAARRDILKARMPQGDIDKAVGMSARLLAKQPAGAKAIDPPKGTPPASEN
jgi:TPR repeat protein